MTRLGRPQYREYERQYLEIDVLLLAEVASNLQRDWWKLGRIDPFNFVTLSSASYQLMLKKLEEQDMRMGMIPNEEIFDIFQAGKSGGLTFVGAERAQANLMELPEYDPSLPEEILTKIDESSLYPSTAITYPMPGDQFEVITDEEELDRILQNAKTSTEEEMCSAPIGHTLDCTIEYCCEAHDGFCEGCADCEAVHKRNELIATYPHKEDVRWGDLSPEQKRRHYGCKHHTNHTQGCDACHRDDSEKLSERLVPDLRRKRVSVSTISLSYALQRSRVKVVEIHRAVQYRHTCMGVQGFHAHAF